MRHVDRFLNNVTMYRLVLYGLIGLGAVSLIASLAGRLSFSPFQMILSVSLILISAFVTNILFAKIWDIPVNKETWIISALIIFFVLQPAHDIASGLALILAGILSSSSKFLLAPWGKHIFNPAAFAIAFVSVLGLLASTWWVGTSALWPFTLVLAIAIILKLRRYALVVAFFGTTLLLETIQFMISGHPIWNGLASVITASPLLFLGGVMLTEPATMPPTRAGQSMFGVIVAALFVLAPELGPLIVYPEVALLAGNIYAFAVSPKRRYRLTLQRIEKISDRVYNYVFSSDHIVHYAAGQYMEWTLPEVPSDGRGNRRSFTLASSPTEKTIQIGMKFYEPSSSFKSRFARLRAGDTVFAGQISGSFTMSGLHGRKLAFIAGGIGITPFRSMLKHIVDENRQEDIVVLYSVSDLSELAYLDVFRDARSNGVRLIAIAPNRDNRTGIVTGPIAEPLLRREIPDYSERTFLISGPNAMVKDVTDILTGLGVRRSRLHTDYFSGY